MREGGGCARPPARPAAPLALLQQGAFCSKIAIAFLLAQSNPFVSTPERQSGPGAASLHREHTHKKGYFTVLCYCFVLVFVWFFFSPGKSRKKEKITPSGECFWTRKTRIFVGWKYAVREKANPADFLRHPSQKTLF